MNAEKPPFYTRYSTFEVLRFAVLPIVVSNKGALIMTKNQLKSPDAGIMLSDGSHKRLSDFWRHQTLVLVFLRHFG